MKSMTGYGKGEAEQDGRKFTVEIKTVNSRYVDINTRIPKSLAFCDELIRRTVQKSVKRGAVDVFVNYENRSENAKEVAIDMQLAGEYVKAAKKLRTEFMLDYDFQATALLRSPDVARIECGKDDSEIVASLAQQATQAAVAELDKMRLAEGEALLANLAELLSNLISALADVVSRAPKVIEEYRQKIEQRMREILKQVEVDEARLLNEVAFFADKSDISEEISRLFSHLAQFKAALDSDEPQGRKLDFISQEILREINTVGSKANDTEILNRVISMKNELEKLKEQIRNAE
ncbi:MAG: YicC family protein [Firmicutes bacterium]|nr:YicC family protein [Bacillota bacterium]